MASKPTSLEEALEQIQTLKSQKRTLEFKLAVAQNTKAKNQAQLQLGVASKAGAAHKLLATVQKKVDNTQSKGHENGVAHCLPSVEVDADELCDLIGMVINNSKAKDAEANVMSHKLMANKVEGLLQLLDVNKDTGLKESEVHAREIKFGRNEIPMDPQASLWSLMMHALEDATLQFLCFAAVISLFIGIFIEKDPMGWLEGTAILTAVVVVVMVGAINDYQKESQFRALNAKKDDMKVTLIRDGKDFETSCHDVVVGDIMKLSTGDILTCDGYAIGNNDLQISEKALTGETDLMKKGEYEIEGDKIKKAPILFAGTMVQDGQGKILVLAVGTGSYQGRMQQKINEADGEHSKSILQEKLDDMTDLITQVGAGAALLTVGVLALRMYLGFQNGLCCKESWDHTVHWSEVLSFLISGVTIFVVAVPEGLPLAVTIALAFSVSKMLKDNNLVRHLSACETMGGATTICSDKTGTLTTSRMTVTKVYVGGVSYDMPKVPVKDTVKKLLQNAAVINSMSKTNLNGKDGMKAPVYAGNDTECGLLVMANLLENGGAEIDYSTAGDEQTYRKIRSECPDNADGYQQFSFSSARKRMSTRIKLSNGKYRVYCKGAAEMVLAICTHRLMPDGSIEVMSDKKTEDAMIISMAQEALRTIVLAYKDCDQAYTDIEDIEKDLIMIGLVGIEDPVRDEVPPAIVECKRAGITVRMVTGDNMVTAAAIAKKCGIIDDVKAKGAVWDGKDFREAVMRRNKDEELNQDAFDQIWEDLRVMGRSTPLDKHLLVTGLQATKSGKERQTVAVTGDGTNDAPALKKADVGFAMGIQGTDVAKNASDIIIMDDNFSSIVAAVMWGRCVYDNICKFLQFQLTVNITAIVIACLGSAILTESPLTAIQMLWVNLIMDSFASLALATEDPTKSLLARSPYPRDRQVLSKTMVKNMVLHAGWQLIVLFALIFGVGNVCSNGQKNCKMARFSNVEFMGAKPLEIASGRPSGFDLASTAASGACPPVFDPNDKKTFTKSYGKVTPLRPEGYCHHAKGSASDTTQHYTLIFNVFVLMQCFNEINSRKIHNEFNVFGGIHKNLLFIVIVVGTVMGQVALIEAPGINTAFGCQSLTKEQWYLSLALGMSVLPLNILFRFVPSGLFPGAA